MKLGNAGTIDGTWGSSAPLAVAAMARQAPASILVVLAHQKDMEPWATDLETFTGKEVKQFPAFESWPRELIPHDPTSRNRIKLLQSLKNSQQKVLVSFLAALMQPVIDPHLWVDHARSLQVGQLLDMHELAEWLVGQGYKRVDAVEIPGEFSQRGGICDLFSIDAELPVRLEFFGDEIESIRTFYADSQLSADVLTTVTVQSRQLEAHVGQSHLVDYLPTGSWVVLAEPEELKLQGRHFLESVRTVEKLFPVDACFAQLLRFPNVVLSEFPRPGVEAHFHLRVESVERFSGNVQRIRDELDGIAQEEQVIIACHNESEIARLSEVLAAGKLATTDRLRLIPGSIAAGFRLIDEKIVVLGSHELFHREQVPVGQKAKLPRRRIESRAIDSFLDLQPGDYVVHVIHGIARFLGMELLTRKQDHALGTRDIYEENLLLEFREGSKLFVPISQIDLVQKYVGGAKSEPQLSKLGGSAWAKKIGKVEEAVRDLASDMIHVQAMREAMVGYAFPEDSAWQNEFEGSFPYQETPDQLTAVAEIKADMMSTRPMDRLLCGDVGYGKTEMAVRAAFKAIDNGKQVAILVPTTILAEQHYRTFSQRMAEYPFIIRALSRMRSAAETREVLRGVKEGSVDVVIGTHRLLSQDVVFKELGLVIIDEEQRFGVQHKERLKQLRSLVDVLTMTATPIPRTLHLSLLGIREISNLETPPPERLPVETRVIRWDDQLIRHAMKREFQRDGQVYFVHNRVHDIESVAEKIQAIVPEARIRVAHGQMTPEELEHAMVDFIQKKAEILLATTIIESGVDIPNANTIFIHEAERYGLADLHQLRGRVGRQRNRAYAYLLLDADKNVTGDAAKRLKAIEEFTDLGAGFRIAMRDLEIRGAGNILGTQQSGHIAAVGYEMYCHLLENAVRDMKKMPQKTPLEVNIDLPWPAFLPKDYVPAQKLRMEVYRRLTRLRDPDKLEDFRQELRDRYGPIPEPTEWLMKVTEIRLLAARWQLGNVHRDGPNVVLTYKNEKKVKILEKVHPHVVKVIDQKEAIARLPEEIRTDLEMYHFLRTIFLPVNS
ncbi:MAG: transcription-repair coupling factor [Zavarzinella sp.]